MYKEFFMNKITGKTVTLLALAALLALSLGSCATTLSISQSDIPAWVEYKVSNGAVTIIRYWGKLKDITIPGRIKNRPVTAIRDLAFYDDQLTSVTIPNSVTSIGKQAFYQNQLTSVTIGNSVTSIGDSAFSKNQLTSVTIPDSVTSIGDSAFFENQLTSVTIPDSVTSIGALAFSDNRLTSVTIPDSVTTIERGALDSNRLTSVTIGNSVTTIEGWAFSNNQLTSVTIPNSVTTIGERAFAGNQLTSVTIPNSVTTIEKGAFANNQLTSVTIPKGVRISAAVFSDNPLTNITIGEGVRLADKAFNGIPLTSITIEGPVDCYLDTFGYRGAIELALMGGRPGTYTRRAGQNWLFNGAPLPSPATLVMDESKAVVQGIRGLQGIRVLKIDGADPAKFYSGKERTYYISPGMHTVEVTYWARAENSDGIYTSRSEGSVTFEHRYLFERKTYLFTGTQEGRQIIFRIVPQ
jgi:hypothetical protein